MNNRKFKVATIVGLAFVACIVILLSCKKEKNEESASGENAVASPIAAKSTGMDFMRIYAKCESIQGGFVFNEEGELESDEYAAMGVCQTFDGEKTPATDMVKIAHHFPSFVKFYHGTDDYLITCLEVHFPGVAEMIQIEYVLNHDFDNPETLMYVTKLSGESKDVQKPVLVKCVGSCDSSTEKCIEVYNFGTGEVHCGCQSDDCSMIIQPLVE